MTKQSNQTTKSPKPKFVITGFTVFIALAVCLILFTFSPLPQFIISLIPNNLITSLFKDTFQAIHLEENEKRIDTPQKFTHTSSLPILGRNTGVCFHFKSTPYNENKEKIDALRLQKAKENNKPIAEVITVDDKNNEYSLTEVSLEIAWNKKKEKTSYLCQKFGREYSKIPKHIEAVYIRPLSPFTPSQIIWFTAADIY